MVVALDKLKNFITGAERFDESDGLMPLRFTEEEAGFYFETNKDSYNKSFASAGVMLCGITDSTTLFFKVDVGVGSSRKFFSFDLFADGEYVGSLDNFNDAKSSNECLSKSFPLGEHEKLFYLKEGKKKIEIYFPWSVSVKIKELSLQNGASFEPCQAQKTLLVYGDSITHGYDALRPFNRYPVALSKLLGATEINKAIGGEVFRPELARLATVKAPDYISVAYGTNDWGLFDQQEYRQRCRDFYLALSEKYPDAQIFALAPIWRKDHTEIRKSGSFDMLKGYISDAVEGLSNVSFVPCYGFVPQDENYFSDLRLHPNDDGFSHYGKNLVKAISEETLR